MPCKWGGKSKTRTTTTDLQNEEVHPDFARYHHHYKLVRACTEQKGKEHRACFGQAIAEDRRSVHMSE